MNATNAGIGLLLAAAATTGGAASCQPEGTHAQPVQGKSPLHSTYVPASASDVGRSGWYVTGGFDHDPNAVGVIASRDCDDDSHGCPTTYTIACGRGRDADGEPVEWRDQPITAAQAKRDYLANSPCPAFGR